MSSYISVELRRLVRERASNRCEYCLMPESESYLTHELDHIYAEKHGGETNEENLCLSCWLCNRHKGTDLASLDTETGEVIPLFHPRNQNWSDHFVLDDAYIRPLTPSGRVTVRLLQLNKRERLDERQILIRLRLYP